MIRLSRIRTIKGLPSDFVGEKLIKKHEDLIHRFAGGRQNPPIRWVSGKWKQAKKRLKLESHGKCAYCEAPTSVVAHGDVEHFRPKSTYWWLAYDIDNYVFACQICNQLFKGDNFPVAGPVLAAPDVPDPLPDHIGVVALAHALLRDVTSTTDQDLLASWGPEDADLVHPYLEDPGELFAYEADDANGEVWLRARPSARATRALDASERYLGINREELRRGRYVQLAILRILHQSFEAPALPAATKQSILDQFDIMRGPAFPYAGLNRFFLRQWGIV